jgi:hypothetical protein
MAAASQASSPTASPAGLATGCSGEVSFFSDGSWMVSGGPGVVQTPQTVQWPCGSYQLSARSRLDPDEVKAARVTVGPLQKATVDLRR